MTAMVDVVFLLLVFFLWTTSLERPEWDLSGAVAMAPAGTAEPTDPQPAVEVPDDETSYNEVPYDEVLVRLRHRPGPPNARQVPVEIWLNDQLLANQNELSRRFREIVTLGAQPSVIVAPDARVPIGEAVAVYDTIRAAGLDHVLFAVEP